MTKKSNRTTMPEDAHESELEKAIGDAEAGGCEIERQSRSVRFYEPRFEPLVQMSCRSIAEMSDGQLEAYIQKYQELVGEAEQALETRRAKLGAARLEKSERARPSRTKKRERQSNNIDEAVMLAASRRILGLPACEGELPTCDGPGRSPGKGKTDSLLAMYWATKKRSKNGSQP